MSLFDISSNTVLSFGIVNPPPQITYSSRNLKNPPLCASCANPPLAASLLVVRALSCQALSWRLLAISSPDPSGVGNLVFSPVKAG